MKHVFATAVTLIAVVAILGCSSDVKEAKGTKSTKPATPVQPAQPSQPAAPAAMLVAGKAAPDITAKDTDGEVFNLSDYRGKVVMLDFWGNW